MLNTVVQRFRTSRFVRDTAVLQSGQLLLVIVQAIGNFFLIRLLRPDRLGRYTLVQTIAAMAGILDITGSVRLTTTYLAQAIGHDDHEQVRDSLAYFLRINVLYNVPLIACFAILAPIVSWNLYHDPIVSRWSVWLALTELTDLPTQLVTISYQASGRMRRLVGFESSRTVLSVLLTIGLLLAQFGIGALVLGTLSISILYGLLSIERYRRLAASDPRFPTWPELLSRARSVPIGNRFRRGFLIAVDKNIGSLLDKLLILFIGTLGTVALSDFSVVYKIVTLPQPLISGIARSLDTFLPKRAGKSDSAHSLRRTFIDTTLFSGAIWSIMTLGLAVGGPLVLLIAFPAYQAALPLIFPLLLQSIGIGLGVGLGPMLRTLHRLEFPIVMQTIAIVAILPFGGWLVSRWGLYGACLLVGLLEMGQVAAMIAVVLWLTRSRPVEPVVDLAP